MGMTDKPELVQLTAEDLQRTLAFALCFDGRRRFRRAEDLMAMITAEHLVKHMELSGMVVLRKRIRQDDDNAVFKGLSEE